MIPYSRLELIVECAKASTDNRTALCELECIQFHSEYAEPGYSDPSSGWIATGNWNKVTKYDEATNHFDTIDDTLGRVAKLLEKLGVELEWSDEWTTCEACNKLVRTSPDSYGWTPSYWFPDCGGCFCIECVKADPAPYLESLEGNNRNAMTIDIDLEENGYVKLQDDFENGFHQGQDANPKVIAKSLHEIGVSRFIFVIDGKGQFDMRFSLWIAKEEMEKLTEEKLAEWEQLPKDGPSVSDGLRRSLQAASVEMSKLPDTPGVKVAKCNVVDGTATAKVVSPDDFVRGKALED